MTEGEHFQYCGTICMAARRLGMRLKIESGPSGHDATWDTGTGFLRVKGAPNRKTALVAACQTLNDHWQVR